MKQSNYYTRQMLQTVQGDELYHHGVQGMRWAFPYVETGFDNKTGKLLFGITGTDS